MGSHVYRMQIISDGYSKFDFRRELIDSSDSIPFFLENYDSHRFSCDYGCRESMTTSLRRLAPQDFPFTIGIRCYGEMYTKLAWHLDNFSSSEISRLENIFYVLFGVRLRLEVGKQVRGGAWRNYPAITVFYYKDGKRVNDRYVTVFIDSKENTDVVNLEYKIPAILGLLREERIYLPIVSGKVEQTLDFVVSELISMSYDRRKRTDLSYDLLTFVGYKHDSLDEILERWVERLAERNNGDASDWFSMLMLAVFCHVCASGEIEFSVSSFSGPVSCASHLNSELLKSFVNRYKGEHLEFLAPLSTVFMKNAYENTLWLTN